VGTGSEDKVTAGERRDVEEADETGGEDDVSGPTGEVILWGVRRGLRRR
jgi:hypothetical protein